MKTPRAFISYSHDNLEHKKWVLELAIRLRNNGIDAILDQFELRAGDDLPHFMETNLESADKIVMVCTQRYIEKANSGEGGVGYEKMIITSSQLKKIDENKVIPIIRQHGENNVPTFLKTKLYINFSITDDFESSYDDLVRTIHNSPLFKKPPVGNNPFISIPKENLDGDIELLHKVLGIIATKQGVKQSTNSSNIAYYAELSEIMFRVIATKLNNLGYTSWGITMDYIKITEKGLMYAVENKLIK